MEKQLVLQQEECREAKCLACVVMTDENSMVSSSFFSSSCFTWRRSSFNCVYAGRQCQDTVIIVLNSC